MLAAAIADPNAALLQPSLLGNPAKPLRFRRPGDMAQDQAPDHGQVHGAVAHRRDAGLRQSGRVRRRRYRLRFQQYADEQKEGAEGQSAACAWAGRERAGDHLRSAIDDAIQRARQADDDAAAGGAGSRTAARTCGLSGQGRCAGPAPSCRHRRSRCRSATCRPKSIRWRRRIGRAAPCRCRRRSTPMPRSRRRRPERSRSAPCRSAPARNGCCRSAMAMPIRRSASAAARSCSSRRSSCRRPMPAIRKAYRTAAASPYFVVAPELLVQSDWSRHALTASITGSYTDYTNGSFVPSLNRPYLNSKIDGRIDVTRDTQIVLENRVLVSTDNPGSPNLQAGLASLPIDTTLGGTLGVVQDFNRLIVSLKGTFDRVQYQNSTLTDGETAQQCRSRSQPICRHRARRLRSRCRRQAVRGSAAGCPRLRRAVRQRRPATQLAWAPA